MITDWEVEFEYFLIENDWHSNFKNNQENSFLKANPRGAVESAFDFHLSEEGFEFWDEVNNLWKEYYDYWVNSNYSDVYVLNKSGNI